MTPTPKKKRRTKRKLALPYLARVRGMYKIKKGALPESKTLGTKRYMLKYFLLAPYLPQLKRLEADGHDTSITIEELVSHWFNEGTRDVFFTRVMREFNMLGGYDLSDKNYRAHVPRQMFPGQWLIVRTDSKEPHRVDVQVLDPALEESATTARLKRRPNDPRPETIDHIYRLNEREWTYIQRFLRRGPRTRRKVTNGRDNE